jgi:hypothetical protein
VLDPLPFKRNLRFYMELYSHERTPGLSYARIGYHYGRPGMTDDHLAIMPTDVRALQLPRWMPAARMGARNSVMYQSEELSSVRLPYASGRLYAGGRIPVWRPTTRGEALRFRVLVTADGEYRVHFVARLDPRGGVVRLRWNGEPAELANGAETVDLYRPYRTLLRDYTLRPREITAGAHTLELLFDGAPDAVTRPEIGIDFVWVQEVR